MTAVARCEKSDLPLGQCGDTCCRPDLVEVKVLPVQYEGTWSEAQYAGTCGCGCGQRIEVGDDIVCADVENGARPRNRTWCLLEHTRSAMAVFGGH